MTTELTLLGWTLVLALIQILLASTLRTQETGVKYNAGPRDGGAPPPRPVTARLQRAQANLFETLPLFAAAVLIAHVSGSEGDLTLWGCWLYLWRASSTCRCMRPASRWSVRWCGWSRWRAWCWCWRRSCGNELWQ